MARRAGVLVKCVIDQRRDIESGQVCAGCRSWLTRTLTEIVELYALLPANLMPGQAQGQRVSGSREAPLPLRVDPLDLTMPARAAVVHDPLGDQVGLLSVATVLDSWVRDWRDVRGKGEGLPGPTVVELGQWLAVRLDDACDDHPAIDEFADEMKALGHQLRRAVGRFEIRPEHLDVPCRRCDLMDLHRLPGEDRVECGSCGDLLTEDEYLRWIKMLAPNTKRAKEMGDLPKWVWDVVVAMQKWDDEHPKLHAEFYDVEAGAHVMKPVDDCGCAALAVIPDDVKVQARVLADYLRQATVA